MVELLLRLAFSLAAVLGLMMVIARIAQRRVSGRKGAPLSVLHRQAVGRHASVAVVSVGSRLLVLGVTDHQVQMITELAPDDLPADDETTGDPVDAADPAASPAASVRTVPAAGPCPVPTAVAAFGADVEAPVTGPSFRAVLRQETARAATVPADGPLAGSLLSPTTWRRAAHAVRGSAS
ncbi:FliO/MopB family protein [Nocardioides sp. SYSU DS0663]|uniref:FliO/MopB family protein n=1 Tax=Nocardioides sp. SYSU DS0663 TaxID=3416445 RepID=UPI003F4C0A13